MTKTFWEEALGRCEYVEDALLPFSNGGLWSHFEGLIPNSIKYMIGIKQSGQGVVRSRPYIKRN